MSEYMTVQEVAERVRSTPGAVYQWRSRGEGPQAIRMGKRLLFRPADVEAWISAHAEKEPATEVAE
jgi:excisionase family DNA binding protein